MRDRDLLPRGRQGEVPHLDFTTVEPFISLMLIFIRAPATSPRTQMLAVYLPAVVVVTQFG